jgi:hypothetical protein
MGDASIDMVILNIDMGYLVALHTATSRSSLLSSQQQKARARSATEVQVQGRRLRI